MKRKYFINIFSQLFLSLVVAGSLVYLAKFYGIFVGIIAWVLCFPMFLIALLAISLAWEK